MRVPEGALELFPTSSRMIRRTVSTDSVKALRAVPMGGALLGLLAAFLGWITVLAWQDRTASQESFVTVPSAVHDTAFYVLPKNAGGSELPQAPVATINEVDYRLLAWERVKISDLRVRLVGTDTVTHVSVFEVAPTAVKLKKQLANLVEPNSPIHVVRLEPNKFLLVKRSS
jgi:hypothetical protein